MRAWVAVLVAVVGMVGCASPGPPRAPSLQLPQVVRDLAVEREGDEVAVRFTLPERTTDGLQIREASVKATLCRGVEGSACVPVSMLRDVGLRVMAGAAAPQRTVSWRDRLPAGATSGKPRLLEYRVELANEEGRTAGWSDAAYTAEGAAPERVEGLRAAETREGILLRWDPAGHTAGDQVVLRRDELSGPAAKERSGRTPTATQASKEGSAKRGGAGRKPGEEPVWLESHAGGRADATLDTTAAEDTEYRYVAVRRRTEQIGGRTIELRSADSQPVEITWLNRFPPAAPEGLSAAPYTENGAYAVDLVWEPIEVPDVNGYEVTRQMLDASGSPVGQTERLGTVTMPAFHDATAKQGVGYRYEVRAVSGKGVEGDVATVVVEP